MELEELRFRNLYENRELFEVACKKARACKEEYCRLVGATCREDFIEVV